MAIKKSTSKKQALAVRSVAPVVIEHQIYLIRGQRIMLDSDLAGLYEVETKVFNQAVKRNRSRFPEDFMFQLTKEEDDSLRSQFVTSNVRGRGGRRYLPYVFTQEGVAMLSSVLNSKRAVEVNINIMRAFVRLREFALSSKEITQRLNEMEKKYDDQFAVVFQAIRKLIEGPGKPKRQIGFRGEGKK